MTSSAGAGPETIYGSDVAIEVLARLGIDHIAFNPGASFRGLHESMVHLGRQRGVLCLSEGVAVAVAHGYGKAAGRPMAVLLHNLVGLQSGAMGLFNAWVDQVAMVVVGGSGPADHVQRRPWIDWIHSAHPQGAVVRDFIKWDAEPASVPGLVDALLRATRLASTPPQGPTYVAFDALLQELPAPAVDLAGLEGLAAPTFAPPSGDLELVIDRLQRARQPVILADRVGRTPEGYRALIELSEITGTPVIDLGARHNFPNTHRADLTAQRRELLPTADFVLALDVRDLRWATSLVDDRERTAASLLAPDAHVVSLGLSELLHRGFLDQEGRIPGRCDLLIGDTAVALPHLVTLAREVAGSFADRIPDRPPWEPVPASPGRITARSLAAAAHAAVREGPWRLTQLRGPVRDVWRFDTFNAHLGSSGGAGLGYGAGAAIGAALAAEGSDLLTVALQPDGDLLYTPSALWTAARERLALLVIVVNNRSYGQDRWHQTLMSQQRGRPAAHIPVGIDLDDPEIDLATMAAAQGVEGLGPVRDPHDLPDVLHRAASMARNEHRPVVVDVHVDA